MFIESLNSEGKSLMSSLLQLALNIQNEITVFESAHLKPYSWAVILPISSHFSGAIWLLQLLLAHSSITSPSLQWPLLPTVERSLCSILTPLPHRYGINMIVRFVQSAYMLLFTLTQSLVGSWLWSHVSHLLKGQQVVYLRSGLLFKQNMQLTT